ncbi:hypothetical protein OAT84_01155 [Gammaproteobacteria bacterium]|nr:hypothetical protein [Gammaproteobacteria bacterium]
MIFELNSVPIYYSIIAAFLLLLSIALLVRYYHKKPKQVIQMTPVEDDATLVTLRETVERLYHHSQLEGFNSLQKYLRESHTLGANEYKVMAQFYDQAYCHISTSLKPIRDELLDVMNQFTQCVKEKLKSIEDVRLLRTALRALFQDNKSRWCIEPLTDFMDKIDALIENKEVKHFTWLSATRRVLTSGKTMLRLYVESKMGCPQQYEHINTLRSQFIEYYSAEDFHHALIGSWDKHQWELNSDDQLNQALGLGEPQA